MFLWRDSTDRQKALPKNDGDDDYDDISCPPINIYNVSFLSLYICNIIVKELKPPFSPLHTHTRAYKKCIKENGHRGGCNLTHFFSVSVLIDAILYINPESKLSVDRSSKDISV
jgi:hypothetical protein